MEKMLFEKDAQRDKWTYKFVSDGTRMAIEINRDEPQYLTVYANLPDMRPVSLFCEPKYGRADVFFDLFIPDNVEVVIESDSEVIDAKRWSYE